VSFTTGLNDSDLLPPTNVTGPANYTDVPLAWTAAQTNEYPIAYYDITITNLYTTIQATAPVLAITTNANVTHADVSGLAPNSTYTVQVSARDTHGGVAPSPAFTVTTKALPGGSGVGNASAQYSSSTGLTVSTTYYVPYDNHLVFIDADNLLSTGYTTGPATAQFGADYRLDDSGLASFTGTSTTSYSWSADAGTPPSVTGTAATGWTYTWNFPLSAFTGAVPLGNSITIGVSGYAPLTWAAANLSLTKQ
jgi:hypothetical protein